MTEETSPKEVVQVTSLDQLGSQKIILEIEEEDRVLIIPAHTLTHSQWYQCERDVPRPTPEAFGTAKGKVYDTDDPAFKAKLDEYWNQVAYLRVLRALDITIPGDTEAEKIRNLQENIGVQAMNAVTMGLRDAHQGKRARVKTHAETFHRNGDSHSPDMQGEGLATE